MKNNRLGLMFLGLAVVCLLASCKKNNGEGEAYNGSGFRAHIEQTGGDNGSKTHINPQWLNNEETSILWTAGDCIQVVNNNGTGTALTYQLSGGSNNTEGFFTSSGETEAFFQPAYVSVYPATNSNNVANSISGTTATINLPATQNYALNSFADKAMPMVAYATEKELEFKNVLGGICFPIVGANGTKVTRLVLTSQSTSDVLWGTCTTTISTSGGAPTSTFSNSDSNKHVITLDCGSGVTLNSSTPTYFCIMVPPGTLESGFTVTAYNGAVAIYEKSTTQSPGANFIPRSVIRKMNGSLEVDDDFDINASFNNQPFGVDPTNP